jgi:hypothetical protein
MRKVTHISVDKHYKEVNEIEDTKEMDERIEKAIKPKEGSDPLTEDARLSAVKRAKFNIFTKSFHDPEGSAAHQKQVERDKLRAAAEARSSTPVDN